MKKEKDYLTNTLWFFTLIMFVVSIATHQASKERVIKSNNELSKLINEQIKTNKELTLRYSILVNYLEREDSN